MPKLSPRSVTKKDLTEFLEDVSDFSFEIRVLNALVNRGFTCEHGGTYDDPVTQKPRQFDIRATRRFGKRVLRLAVECKNLRDTFPLLISCVPRAPEESFHEIVYSFDPHSSPLEEPTTPDLTAFLPHSRSVRLVREESFYQVGEPVGKSCDQVGRTPSGEIVGGSADVYEKWAQALSSAHDLTYAACNDGNERTGKMALSLVFPVVVVPNGRLWSAQFDQGGSLLREPESVHRCPYFVGRSYFHKSVSGGDDLTLSHLEFVTLDGLGELVGSLCQTEADLKRAFPFDLVGEILQNQ